MNIGLTQQTIGDHREAVESLSGGIAGLPTDWLNAEWMHEYQQALDQAEAAEDDSPSDQD
jgi:hypothetical protein